MLEETRSSELDAHVKGHRQSADIAAASAGSSSATADPTPGSHADSQVINNSSLYIHPLLLTITPQNLEQEFWRSSRITHQLMTVDKTAFIMSTLNLYSGSNAAYAVKSPRNRLLLQYLCVLYFLLSLIHQWYIQARPRQYLEHREMVLVATRVFRAAWVIIMFGVCQATDIFDYFVSKKLHQGSSPAAVTLALLSLSTVAILSQCLYYPLRFRLAFILQVLYVGASLSLSNRHSCVLQRPELSGGAGFWCEVIQSLSKLMYVFFSLDADSSRDLCEKRSADQLLASWMVSFGLVVPLYILYVKEFTEKQRFLQHKCRQQYSLQDDGSLATRQVQSGALGTALNLVLLLHAAAVTVMLMIGFGVADLVVQASKPTFCHV